MEKVAGIVQPASSPWTRQLTSALWLPMSIAAAYLLVLRSWFHQMQSTSLQGVDPFKQTSWVPAAVASVAYLVFVFLGRKFMAARKPMELRDYMFTYNVYQIVLNIWCVAGFAKEILGWGDAKGMMFWGNRFDPSPAGFKLGFYIWVHYNNKFVELLDTAWMVLRKKDRQVSVLHVYHHVLMMWAWLFVVKKECGGDAWFGACVNSAVHVVMYGYYLMAQVGVPCPWKKYLTMMQMAQFCACMCHSVYVLAVGNSPLAIPLLQAFVMLNMIVLFSNFYLKTYSSGKAGASNGHAGNGKAACGSGTATNGKAAAANGISTSTKAE